MRPLSQLTILGKGYDVPANSTAYYFALTGTPFTINWGTFDGTSHHGFSATVASLGLAASTWYHFYGDYTGAGGSPASTWRFALNGTMIGSGVSDAVGPSSNPAHFTIGAAEISPGGTYVQNFQGCMADAALFSGPLTLTEITKLGNGTLRPPGVTSKTLWGSWAMDLAPATQPDGSSFGNNGAANGTVVCGSSSAIRWAYTR